MEVQLPALRGLRIGLYDDKVYRPSGTLATTGGGNTVSVSNGYGNEDKPSSNDSR